MSVKYITAEFGYGENIAVASKNCYQWDKGIVLVQENIDVPDGSVLEAVCSFDTQENGVGAIVNVEDGKIKVAVPDTVLSRGVQVFTYVSLAVDDSNVTIYEVRLPVISRSKPHNYEMNDDDRATIETLLSAVNEAVAGVQKLNNIDATVEIFEKTETETEASVQVTSEEDTTTFGFRFPEVEQNVNLGIEDGNLVGSVNDGEPEIIGRIIPSYRGEWVSGETYQTMDVVKYENCLYVCRKDVELSEDAPTAEGQEEFWTMFADLNLDMSQLEEYAQQIEELQQMIESAKEELEQLAASSVVAEMNAKMDELSARLEQLDASKLNASATFGDEEKIMWVNGQREIVPSNVKLFADHGILLNGYELYIDDYGNLLTRKV